MRGRVCWALLCLCSPLTDIWIRTQRAALGSRHAIACSNHLYGSFCIVILMSDVKAYLPLIVSRLLGLRPEATHLQSGSVSFTYMTRWTRWIPVLKRSYSIRTWYVPGRYCSAKACMLIFFVPFYLTEYRVLILLDDIMCVLVVSHSCYR